MPNVLFRMRAEKDAQNRKTKFSMHPGWESPWVSLEGIFFFHMDLSGHMIKVLTCER